MEDRTKPQMPPRIQNTKNYNTIRRHVEEKLVDVAQSKSYPRKHQLCVICCSLGKTSLQANPKTSKFAPRGRQKQEIQPSTMRREGASVVVRSCRSDITDSPQRSLNIYYNRCIRSRMGSHSKRQEPKWHLDHRSTTLAQQPKGAMDIKDGSSKSGTSLQISNSLSSNGQQIRGSIHHQTRGEKLLKTTTVDDRYTGNCTSTSNTPCSPLLARKIQPAGRQPLEISPSTRMDTVEAVDANNIQQMGHTINRPFRELSLSSCKTICERRCTRSGMCFRERLQQNMALRPRLALSPTVTDTTSVTTLGEEHRNILIRGPELGKDLLESGIETAGTKSPIYDPQLATAPNGPENGETSTRSGKAVFAGMEGSGWASLVETWHEENKILLGSAWRKSTLRTYKIAWERWRVWSRGKCQIDNPKPDDLSKFICFLHNDVKLAPSTIAVHKSVVATFANPEKSEALARHPLVKQIMKAVAITKPPPRKPSTWEAGSLIEYLQHYSIDVDSLFQISRHVTALLLLSTGRRIHDLTLLDISPEFFENNGDHVIFWPRFGSKTDSATHRQSGWHLSNKGPERLNPFQWIQKLISVSHERRRARENLNSLFITTRGKVNAASRTVIAGWIRTLFREANIQDSPGSFRAAVNSDMWINRNINIDEVLRRGNWKSRDTFLKYYFKEVTNRNRDLGGTNLTDLFSPV